MLLSNREFRFRVLPGRGPGRRRRYAVQWYCGSRDISVCDPMALECAPAPPWCHRLPV